MSPLWAHVHTTLLRPVDNEGGGAVGLGMCGDAWEISVSSFQFCYEFQTSLKNKNF
jgi:hypothetical protein